MCVCPDLVFGVRVFLLCVSRSHYEHKLRKRTAFQLEKLAAMLIFSTTENCDSLCVCARCVCVCVQWVRVSVVRTQNVKAHGLAILERLLRSHFQNQRRQSAKVHSHCAHTHTHFTPCTHTLHTRTHFLHRHTNMSQFSVVLKNSISASFSG